MSASHGRLSGPDGMVRVRRVAVGLTQEELAELSGLSVRAISDIERGITARPRRSSTVLLEAALDLTGSGRDTPPGDGRLPAGGLGPFPPGLVPRQLPQGARGFVGRVNELKALTELLSQPEGAGGTVVITAIAGTAGVGKTTLAVRWAHGVAESFPDGQLFVNLRGYDPDRPVMAADALAGFLRVLGGPGQDVPAEVDERAARYRSLLAGRRVLVVLDNAKDPDQVRALLPATPGCLAVVTSRDSLAGLVAREGAMRVDLDLLPLADAITLLRELIGGRVDAEPHAAAALAAQCARLPLALRVAAELAAARTDVPLSGLVDELADQKRRLDLLDAGGDPRTAVRAVLSWSYQQLSDQAARMFRLLGVHPGPDISPAAAASLVGIPLGQSRALLRELIRSHLLTEHVAGRFAFHDVLRAYAAERAADLDNDAGRRDAIHRALDHYLHTVSAADRLLYPSRRPVRLAARQPGVTLAEFSTECQALAWLDADHHVLVAAVRLAANHGFDRHAWQLSYTLQTFFDRRSHWRDWAATQHIALDAARRIGTLNAQAEAHRGIANAQIRLDRTGEALAHLRQGLRLADQAGDTDSRGRLHQDISRALVQQGRYYAALRHARHALRIARRAGHQVLQAEALNDLGWNLAMLGQYEQALGYCQQALTLHRQLGNKHAEPFTLDSVAYAHRHLGHYSEAAACYRQAVELYADLGFRYQLAETLNYAGDAYQAGGDLSAARHAWIRALAILDGLRHPDAGHVRAKLG